MHYALSDVVCVCGFTALSHMGRTRATDMNPPPLCAVFLCNVTQMQIN